MEKQDLCAFASPLYTGQLTFNAHSPFFPVSVECDMQQSVLGGRSASEREPAAKLFQRTET